MKPISSLLVLIPLTLACFVLRNCVNPDLRPADFQAVRGNQDESGFRFVYAGERLTAAALRELRMVKLLNNESENEGGYLKAVNDDDIEQFRQAINLRSIDLSGCLIDGTSLKHVCELSTLREIFLTKSTIGDEAGRFLRRFLSLDTLWLEHTSIGDLCVCELWKISVQKLNLDHTLITDEGILRMPLDRQFEYLSLRSTYVGDRAARHLSQLTLILELDLSRTNVTAQGAKFVLDKHESGNLGIRKLVLTGCKITSEEISELRMRYLDVEIDY